MEKKSLKWTWYGKEKMVGKHRSYFCTCQCGLKKWVRVDHIRRGLSKGCRACGAAKHRASEAKGNNPLWVSTYKAYKSMMDRCYRSNHSAYSHYGGRGITVCLRWTSSFIDFVADVGWKPAAHLSLDRIDNEGNYEPGNIRWATPLEQNNNRRRIRWVVYGGRYITLSDLCRELNLNRGTIYQRLHSGWSMEKAITTPVLGRRPSA